MRTIHRYPNRRLYDVTTKGHVGYPEIVELVRLQTPFRVVCTKTRNDITEVIRQRAVSLTAYRKTYGRQAPKAV